MASLTRCDAQQSIADADWPSAPSYARHTCACVPIACVPTAGHAQNRCSPCPCAICNGSSLVHALPSHQKTDLLSHVLTRWPSTGAVVCTPHPRPPPSAPSSPHSWPTQMAKSSRPPPALLEPQASMLLSLCWALTPPTAHLHPSQHPLLKPPKPGERWWLCTASGEACVYCCRMCRFGSCCCSAWRAALGQEWSARTCSCLRATWARPARSWACCSRECDHKVNITLPRLMLVLSALHLARCTRDDSLACANDPNM